LGQSIQNNNIDEFFNFVAISISWFKLLRCSNYSNSTSLFLLQWNFWKDENHPILPFLRRNFKATSEEYGESAIHRLMTHIREWNYEGDNLKKRWKETSVAWKCFGIVGITSSHKDSCIKWFSINEPEELMAKSGNFFSNLCVLISKGKHLPFKRDIGYTSKSTKSEDTIFWESFLNKRKSRIKISLAELLKLELKISKSLRQDAFEKLDPEDFI
jgi:hypothetical protein